MANNNGEGSNKTVPPGPKGIWVGRPVRGGGNLKTPPPKPPRPTK